MTVNVNGLHVLSVIPVRSGQETMISYIIIVNEFHRFCLINNYGKQNSLEETRHPSSSLSKTEPGIESTKVEAGIHLCFGHGYIPGIFYSLKKVAFILL